MKLHFSNNHTYVTELAHNTLWTHTNCISVFIKRATTAIRTYWSSFGRAFVWKFRVYWIFTWIKPFLVDTDINKYDSTDDYEAVFWIMNLLSLQWIPSNISEHLHPKVPFPYSTHVPPFLQYASPLGLHLSNQNQFIIIKKIFVNVSKITYLFHIGCHHRVYYNCMLFFHHSLQHTFHHFYKHLRCLESICLFEKKAQYLNHSNT